MAAGMILLLSFQIFWLSQRYQDARTELQKDANLMFIETVREVEDSVLNQILLPGKIRSMEGVRQIQSIDVKKIRTTSDTNIELRVRSDLRAGDSTHFFGSVAMFIALDDSSLEVDSSMEWHSSHPEFLSVLEDKFGQKAGKSTLPVSRQLIVIEDQSGLPPESGRFVDIGSGKSYGVELTEYRTHIFRQLWPDILFSVFLFASLLGAFLLMNRSFRQQARLTRIKNDFISNVTHELKTPITTVGVAIEALRNFHVLENPERTREYLDISRHELDRLAILVDKVLKMSLFEQGAPELKLEQIDLKELINDILRSMKLQFDKLTAQVRFQANTAHTMMMGDRIHLTNVIYNLLDNALKYSPGNASIDIELQETANQIQLKVQDQGIGIPAEYRNKIFEKFFRVPNGDRHDVKGYGLGLSYVASVVHKHQGSIGLESQPGQGSCFTIQFPKANG